MTQTSASSHPSTSESNPNDTAIPTKTSLSTESETQKNQQQQQERLNNNNQAYDDDDDWLEASDDDNYSRNNSDGISSASDSDANEASIDLDSVLDLESTHYQKGFEKGKQQAKRLFVEEGKDFGHKQGLLLGFEFGEYLRKDPETLYDWMVGKFRKDVNQGDEFVTWTEKVRSKIKVIQLREKRSKKTKKEKPRLKVDRMDTLDF